MHNLIANPDNLRDCPNAVHRVTYSNKLIAFPRSKEITFPTIAYSIGLDTDFIFYIIINVNNAIIIRIKTAVMHPTVTFQIIVTVLISHNAGKTIIQ